MSLGGLPFFQFEEFGFLTSGDGIYGTVMFRFAEDLGDRLVSHTVTVKARVKVSPSDTIERMQEVLLQKAVDQLHLALSAAEDRTAQQLLSEARERVEAERWKPEGMSLDVP